MATPYAAMEEAGRGKPAAGRGSAGRRRPVQQRTDGGHAQNLRARLQCSLSGVVRGRIASCSQMRGTAVKPVHGLRRGGWCSSTVLGRLSSAGRARAFEPQHLYDIETVV